ncbi:MAG: UPF0182 family protein [Chloroflexi bacterium]|nr:UPF0182 family protein [Chloroflexota bacterium]
MSRLVAGALIAFLIVILTVGVDVYTEWLWFGSLGLLSVYQTVLSVQVLLFLAASATFMVAYLPSAFLARRLAHQFEHDTAPDEDVLWAYIARVGARIGEQAAYRQVVNVGIVVLGLLLAAIMGAVASGQWPTVMRFLNQEPFGTPDPIFGLDVSFFVFTLPFLRVAHSWLLGTAVLVATTTFAVYAVVTAYELGVNLERVVLNVPRGVRIHVASIVASILVLVAANHVLDVYDLVYSTRGVAYGAGYAAVHAELPALYFMAGFAVAAAILIVVSGFTRSFRLALSGLAAWGIVALFGGLVFPNLIESFEVRPNQLEKERPYLTNTIAYTRRAFGLDAIQEQFFPADDAVTPAEVRASPGTIQNIRLWDHRPLQQTLNQIQSIRSYYRFEDVDVDRYVIDGVERQVMVAARELYPEGLQTQARTWVNQRLKFTHGYGVAMSLVATFGEEGRPQLVVQDVPPTGSVPIDRPEIYYGSRAAPYVLVKTSETEFDYPRGDDNVETRHAGSTGINVGGLIQRLAFALRFRDMNLLVSGAIRPETELLWRRSVAERVGQIAPFLLQDRDPYIVVADGKLFWMLDAYTYTSSYPYSQPLFWRPDARAPGIVMNYIRNSVKVVVNAYDGSIRFYVATPGDPLIQSYQRIFPGLFLPLSEMPDALRMHVRYPEDLFRIQADRYQTFHMQDPTVFYNREDVWAIPKEKFYNAEVDIDPYYVIMRMPGEPREEFLLMEPFTPLNKSNMIAWLAARMDADNYGKLLVYKYPKDKLIYGPAQVEGRIDQDPAISSQFTLWSQSGSQIIRGNMLVIPVGNSNLYVEPIYLQAENGPIPELKRVIVATGNRVVMEPTLEEALGRLFGGTAGVIPQSNAAGTPSQAALPAASSSPSQDVAALVRSAGDHFARAQEALRSGDWARYGQEQQALEQDLRRLGQLTGQP